MKRKFTWVFVTVLGGLVLWRCGGQSETVRLNTVPEADVAEARTAMIEESTPADDAAKAPTATEGQKSIRPAVMAPLEVKDWDGFKALLARAESVGVTTVSTDVWWGLVEKEGDQRFDWQYYEKVSDAVVSAGLKWVPILSFHQCGGGVGDDCDIPIPKWVWKTLGGKKTDTLKYKSEKNKLSNEYIALWSDDKAGGQYRELITAFRDHFSDQSAHIEEINISAGPTGELRYPSYNPHDGFQYPERGYLQAYSDAAVADFRRYVKEKYGTLDAVNAAWQTTLSKWKQIGPPSDAPGFFARKDYLDIQYGKDFTAWYNGALTAHGAFLLGLATESLAGSFEGVPLGIKIPGVHWLMASPDQPRSAEVSAGLITTAVDINADQTAHGYGPILDMIKSAATLERGIVLHFTCLEMDNEQSANQNTFSRAKDLVFWIGAGAAARGLPIMGENALAGGVMDDHGWDNIENAIQWSAYSGLTTLRIGDLAVNNGTGFRRYGDLIRKYGTQLNKENGNDATAQR